MPGESGLDLIRGVLAEHQDVAIIMVTVIDDPVIAEAALETGVHDYNRFC